MHEISFIIMKMTQEASLKKMLPGVQGRLSKLVAFYFGALRFKSKERHSWLWKSSEQCFMV